jgi:hypothetical protein
MAQAKKTPKRQHVPDRLLAPGKRKTVKIPLKVRQQALRVAMRVKVEERPGMPQFGVLVGLLLDEHGDMLAVVRLDHFGLMLKALHPSKVVPVTSEDEEAHKP